jgi:tRNA/tmRNA/rRNA uracil-C5-methylase (TrmA/RlmC/RlmD family)
VDIQGDDLMALTDTGLGLGRIAKEQPDDVILPTDLPSTISSWTEWEVRVPMVIPGERVRARIFKNFDTYSEGDLVRVVQESPLRIQPKCKLAGSCAGCQFQHVSIESQRQWKTEYVRKGLLEQSIAGYTTVLLSKNDDNDDSLLHPAVGTDEIFEYRSKLTPHYEAPIRNKTTDEFDMGPIGFQQISSRQVIDVEECPIATPAINSKLAETRVELYQKAKEGVLNGRKKRKRNRRSTGDAGATLLFREADPDAETGNPVVVTDNNEYMTTTVKGIAFRYQAGNFFQNNNYVLPLMVDGVLNAAIQPTAAGDVPKYFIDCYCGSGLFALTAASKFDLCVGIEVNNKAIAEATANAKSNNISNCQFMAASAEAIFKSPPKITLEGFEDQSVQTFPRDKTVVVLDPPRKGCSGVFLEQLYEYSPQRIVYMSCGPNTQARDAKGIVEIGGYDIVSIQPYDLFPQTKHIECLMIFEKKASK